MNKKLLRVQWRVVWFDLVERWHDLLNILLPIFIVSGLLVACFRFWLWLFGVL